MYKHIIVLILAISQSSYGQSINNDRIDSLLTSRYESGQLHGSVLIGRGDSVLYSRGFGYANREWQIPNDMETKFRIGSLTKPFSAAVILKLQETGQLKLTDTISSYLPAYPAELGNKITIYQLLSHTSGLRDLTEIPEFWSDSVRIHYPKQKLVNDLAGRGLIFQPGSRFQYCNSGYILLGAIVENVTSKTFGKALNEYFLGPLDMNNTGVDSHNLLLPRRALGYMQENAKYIPAPYIYIDNAFAAGGMYSTPNDLFKWSRALDESDILHQSTWNNMFKKHKGPYGLGWYVKNVAMKECSKEIYYHTGHIHGFHNLLVKIPEDKLVLILLNNINYVPMAELRDQLLQLIYDDPNLKIVTAVE